MFHRRNNKGTIWEKNKIRNVQSQHSLKVQEDQGEESCGTDLHCKSDAILVGISFESTILGLGWLGQQQLCICIAIYQRRVGRRAQQLPIRFAADARVGTRVQRCKGARVGTGTRVQGCKVRYVQPTIA